MADTKTSALATAAPASGDKLYLSKTSGGPLDRAAVISAALADVFAGTNPFLKYQSVSISSGTLTIDYNAGNVAYVSLNANITTLTISNWPSSGTFGRLSVRFQADGTARSITWPAAVKWDGGTAPSMASTSNHATWVHLITADAGTTIDGLIGAADVG